MNVLIVDDQRDVALSIKNSVEWQKFSIKEVFVAFSADEARNIMEEHVVHIMLCDIEMPKENGLTLFRWVHEKKKEIECVFLTAHAEFEYAQEALHLGSFDYILQPAKPEQIEEVIHKICMKIVRNSNYVKLRNREGLIKEQKGLLLDGFIMELIQEKEQKEKLGQKISMFMEQNYHQLQVCPVLLHITRWKTNVGEWESHLIRKTLENILKEIFGDYEVLLSRIDKSHYCFLLGYEEGAQEQSTIILGLNKFHEFTLHYMEFEAALYCGDSADCLELYQNIHRLLKQEKNNVMLLSKVFYDFSDSTVQDLTGDLLLLHIEQWESWLEGGLGKRVKEEIVKYIIEVQKKGEISVVLLKKLHTNFTKAFYCALGNQRISVDHVFEGNYSYEQFLESYYHYQTFMEAVNYVLSYLEKALEKQLESEENQIEKAILYIRNHIDKNINRSEVAAHVFLNPEYLSRYFKKKTGYMLKDFIQKEKIQFAKNLLETTNLSVSIVASKVGFNNFSHFSTVFRKLEGKTPQEYRQQYK